MTEGWDGDNTGRKFAKAVLFGFMPLALAATGVFFWATAPSNGGGDSVASTSNPQPASVESAPATGTQPEVIDPAVTEAQLPGGQGRSQGTPSGTVRRTAATPPSRFPSQGAGAAPAVPAEEVPDSLPASGAAPEAAPEQVASAETQQTNRAAPGAGPANNPANPPAMPRAPGGTAANVLFNSAAGGFAIAAVVTAAKENDGGSPFSP